MQDRFVVYESRSPINWVQKLRAYGSKIRDSTTSLGYIEWSDDGQQLLYKELEFTIEGLRGFSRKQTELAQEQLAELLLVHPDEDREDVVPETTLSRLKDDLTIQQEGWSFLQDTRNGALQGHDRWLLRRALGNCWLREEFLLKPTSRDPGPKWKRSRVEYYLAEVEAFLERLLLLFHILGGPACSWHRAAEPTMA